MNISHLSLVAHHGGISAHSKTAQLCMLVLLVLLSACGQKGPLKLPAGAQLATPPVTAAALTR